MGKIVPFHTNPMCKRGNGLPPSLGFGLVSLSAANSIARNFRESEAEFPINPTRPLTVTELCITLDVEFQLLRTRNLHHCHQARETFARPTTVILMNQRADSSGAPRPYSFFETEWFIFWIPLNGYVRKIWLFRFSVTV